MCMCRSRWLRRVGVLLTLAVCVCTNGCEDTGDDGAVHLASKPETDSPSRSTVAPKTERETSGINEECEALIESLVSPNTPPTEPDEGVGYGVMPEHIWTIVKKLGRHGVNAFPALVKHINDDRYVYTTTGGGGTAFGELRHKTVGSVCKDIIEGQLGDHPVPITTKGGGRLGTDGRMHRREDYFSSKGGRFSPEWVDAWWKKHRTSSLREIRIDVILWCIDREKTIGFPTEQDREKHLDPLLQRLEQLENATDEEVTPRIGEPPQPIPRDWAR